MGSDTIGKRVKLLFGRAPLSKTFGSKVEKASAKTVDAILMGLTPTTGGKAGSAAAAVAGSSPSRGDKGKSPVVDSGVMTINFTLPSNFLVDDVVDHRKLFPHLGSMIYLRSRNVLKMFLSRGLMRLSRVSLSW